MERAPESSNTNEPKTNTCVVVAAFVVTAILLFISHRFVKRRQDKTMDSFDFFSFSDNVIARVLDDAIAVPNQGGTFSSDDEGNHYSVGKKSGEIGAARLIVDFPPDSTIICGYRRFHWLVFDPR